MGITYKQAQKVAIRILSNNYGVYGKGNFDLKIDEFAKVLYIAFNSVDSVVANDKLTEYYNHIK